MKIAKMTMAQALVKFLDNQYVSMDGVETKFVEGVFTVFGHGIVLGLGQALDENPGQLRVYQGRNEQGMAHVAAGFAKQNERLKSFIQSKGYDAILTREPGGTAIGEKLREIARDILSTTFRLPFISLKDIFHLFILNYAFSPKAARYAPGSPG